MEKDLLLITTVFVAVVSHIVFEESPVCSDPLSTCVLSSNCMDEDLERNQICGFRNLEYFVCCRSRTEPFTPTPATAANTPGTFEPDTNKSLSNDCGRTPSLFFNRIVGGEEVDAKMWPWLVILYIDDVAECGGSFISQDWVLTASHCVFADSAGRVLIAPNRVKVRLGVSNLTLPAKFRSVSEVVPHPEYGGTRNYANDIALLRLSQEMNSQEEVKAICLPGSTGDPADPTREDTADRMAFVAGWGRTNQESRKGSDVLLQTQVKVLSETDCLAAYKNIFNMTSTSFCGGLKEGGKDACQGDSGGPLMLPGINDNQDRFYAVGIVSFGYGCGNADFPGGYTKTSLYRSWIEQKMNSSE